MSRNQKAVWLAGIGAVVLLVIIWRGYDFFRSMPEVVDCGDGPRRSIDIRDFITQYSAYSVELEAAVHEQKISAKLNPVQLQQLSESLQHANEFRKFLVAGYNACAVSKEQYSEHGATFQSLDSLSRQINTVLAKPELSADEGAELPKLVNQYIKVSQKLSS